MLNRTYGTGWRISGMVSALLLVALSGCQQAIVGNWYLEKAVPSRDAFSMDNVTFHKDGTFTATTVIEGRTAEEAGTYSFVGYRLTLRPSAGGRREYTTVLKGSRLQVKERGRSDRVVTLRKGQRE